jgi:hypothetical protein
MKLQLEDTSPQLHEVHALKNPARLRQQAKHLRAKASRSEYAVSELAKSIARTGLLKRLLDGMHAEQKTATDEGDRLWVNYMKAKTIKKLEKLGDAKHLQELRIRRMLDKAEMLEGLAESLKGAGGKTIVQS